MKETAESLSKKRSFFGLYVDDRKTPYILLAIVIGLWILCWFLVTYFIDYNEASWSIRGQFGDMFGAINALFSGLAFAGIIYTILLQRAELEEQRNELRLTRKEFKKQNKTLSRNNFETNFFNLINIHHNALQQIKIETVTTSSDFGKSKTVYIGADAFEIMNKILKSEFSRIHLTGDELNNSDKIKFQNMFQTLCSDWESSIVLYFQGLATTLYIIGNSTLIKDDDRILYFQILNSHMTPHEKTFMYYFMSCYKRENFGGAAFCTIHRLENKFRFMTYSDLRTFHYSHSLLKKSWEDIYRENEMLSKVNNTM